MLMGIVALNVCVFWHFVERECTWGVWLSQVTLKSKGQIQARNNQVLYFVSIIDYFLH